MVLFRWFMSENNLCMLSCKYHFAVYHCYWKLDHCFNEKRKVTWCWRSILLARWEVVELETRWRAIWCRSFGIQPWCWGLLMKMKIPEGFTYDVFLIPQRHFCFPFLLMYSLFQWGILEIAIWGHRTRAIIFCFPISEHAEYVWFQDPR